MPDKGQPPGDGGSRPLDEGLFTAEPLRSQSDLARAQLNKESARRIVDEGGDPRQAVKLLSEAVEIEPDPTSLTLLAELEMANPLWRQRALDRLKQAVNIAPQHTEAWLALANYWSLRGQKDKQVRCLQRILTYEPRNMEVREALELVDPEALQEVLVLAQQQQQPKKG